MLGNEAVLDRLKSGIPPIDINTIHIGAKNFHEVINFLTKEIKAANAIDSLRKIYLVAPRGMGKTHALLMIESIFSEDSEYEVFRVNQPDEPIALLKSLIGNWGKENLVDTLEQFKSQNSLSDPYQVYQALQQQISYFSPFNIAISYLDDPEFGDLAWKWFSDRLGPGEASSLRFERHKITKNLSDEVAIPFLKAFCQFLKLSTDKCPIFLIDEFTQITYFTPRKRKLFKGFLVNLVNEVWNSGLFICFACTDHIWGEIENDEFSVSIGLTRRARKIDMYGLSSLDEVEQLFEKILLCYPKPNHDVLRKHVSDLDILENLYTEFLRNPGEIIKNLISSIERFLENSQISKSPRPISELIEPLIED